MRVVDVMDSGDSAHLSLMKRPDLGVTFTKLHCWTLTHYSKCVFMDADTLVRNRPDASRKHPQFRFRYYSSYLTQNIKLKHLNCFFLYVFALDFFFFFNNHFCGNRKDETRCV